VYQAETVHDLKKTQHFDIYNEIHEYPIRYERKPKAKIKGVY
jgi:hypothetical protein